MIEKSFCRVKICVFAKFLVTLCPNFYCMVNYIQSIEVKKILHLHDFTIPVSEDGSLRHVLITGPNGSGKTVMLRSIWSKLMSSPSEYAEMRGLFQSPNDMEIRGAEWIDSWTPLNRSSFVVAYYSDYRQSQFKEVVNPEKPVLDIDSLDKSVSDQFLRFLVDQKVQQALAKTNDDDEQVRVIQDWFASFEELLQELFNDAALKLEFDYKSYTFYIHSEGKRFTFSQLSAGYSAALDIITDLMLKMQKVDRLVRAYDMEGIVLIDEVETHLHLSLQKQIMPMLTRIFPKVQFIVTTHSPFVLNSLDNAVAFDMVSQTPIDDLTDYSSSVLAEGYFGVQEESTELVQRLNRMAELIALPKLGASEEAELKHLMSDFERVPDAIAPNAKTRYRELKIKLQARTL